MSDIRTMIEQVVRETRIDNAESGSQAESDVKIAIIDAMDFHKKDVFWFNKSWASMQLSIGQYRYQLPLDFLSVTGDVTLVAASNDPASRRRLFPATLNEVIESSYVGTDPSESILTGTPAKWAVDGSTNELILIPVPSVDGDRIEFQYSVNFGIPSYAYSGSAWAFYEPNTIDALSATFTSPWLAQDKGYKLIFFKTAYTLLSGVYGGTEQSALRANEYVKKWYEELGRLKGESTKRSSAPAIRRHI